jgi:predicted ATPase
MADIKKQWDEATTRLLELAESRKNDGFEPWNDPDAFKQILLDAENFVKRKLKKIDPDISMANPIATVLFQERVRMKSFLLISKQLRKLPKGRIHDSLSSFAEVSFYIEVLIQAQSDLMYSTANAYADQGQNKTARDLYKKAYRAVRFLPQLEEDMRQRHDQVLRFMSVRI